MTAFSLSSLTISGSTLTALRGITSSLAQTNGATFFATASVLQPHPVVSASASTVINKIQTQLQQNKAQQQALTQASGVVNSAVKGATQIAAALTQLRSIVTQASQSGASTTQLQSLAQQFNTALSGIASSIQSSGFGGVNLLNGTNVQSFQASGLNNSALQALNFQAGVVGPLTANSLQNALSSGGNPFSDLINRIEAAVTNDVGQASASVIANFTTQFINQAGGTGNQSQVSALGNQLINDLNGQTQTDHQTQRLVGRVLDSITDNVPQSQTTALINQLITGLQNQLTPSTNLQGADFAGANLQGVNFAGVNLQGADFTGANLQGANFTGANLQGANFEGANLQGSNLQGANIQNAYFKGANLQDTIYQNSPPPAVPEPFIPEPPPPTGQNFERQNLTGANFSSQNLKSADFERSRVQGANFVNTNLAGASFERSNAQGANFGGANLASADFAGANLQGANFAVPPPSGGGGGTGGGGGGGGPSFEAVLGSVNQAISTVNNGLDILNQEAQAIKDQSKSSSDLTSVLNKEVGNLVNTNLTAETAKISSLQLAVNLGLQTISITGQRAQGLLQTLFTGQSTTIPTSSPQEAHKASQTTTQFPNQSQASLTGNSSNGPLGTTSNKSTKNGVLVPPINPVPSSLLSTALNLQV